MSPLDTIADRQSEWSQTANHLKSRVDKVRWLVFLLSILGALAAAVASQMEVVDKAPLVEVPRTWVAILGALSLATATFLTSRLLGAEQVAAWVRARAISEALKSAAYRFAARAAPYDGPDEKAVAHLEEERRKIEGAGSDLLSQMVKATGKGTVPRKRLSPDEYITARVKGQAKDFYRPKAEMFRATANRLRRVEFVLALTATLITAVASVTGKTALISGFSFDIAALTAVLTTIATSVLAHIEASRFNYLATSYLAAARQLEDLQSGGHGEWSGFVNACEGVIATENASWIAKWTRLPE